jgi:DNA-directed RNA polymerase specialized sigma24 family protein
MSALQNQYWKCYKYYTEYKTQFLVKDIQSWEVRNICYFNFRPADIAEIRSELKCLLLADIKKKYQASSQINHPRNYVLKTCKYDLFDILRKTKKHKKLKSKFEYDWKVKMIDAKNRKNGKLLTTLDEYSYEEIRELFKSVLNITEMAVVYLVHCEFEYEKIAKTLKISDDYCRKLYNQAENKLKKALALSSMGAGC